MFINYKISFRRSSSIAHDLINWRINIRGHSKPIKYMIDQFSVMWISSLIFISTFGGFSPCNFYEANWNKIPCTANYSYNHYRFHSVYLQNWPSIIITGISADEWHNPVINASAFLAKACMYSFNYYWPSIGVMELCGKSSTCVWMNFVSKNILYNVNGFMKILVNYLLTF